jgi:hypothetical protein
MLNFDLPLSIYTLSGYFLVLLFSLIFIGKYTGKKLNSKRDKWVWGGISLALLIWIRLPFVAYNQELDIDESQMLAQALTLSKYWVYWQYVDGTTQGPLTSYFLVIPSWFGLDFDYTSARGLGLVLLSATLLLNLLTFRNFFGWLLAAVIFAPIAFFYILSQGIFSTLYNEYLTFFLLSLALYVFSEVYSAPEPKHVQLFFLGFVLGMIPFAKLQGVPTALVIALFAAILVLRKSQRGLKPLGVLVAGGLLFPVVVILLTVKFDVFEFFWKFYIIGNMEYSSGNTMLQNVLAFSKFLRASGQFPYLLLAYVLLFIYGLRRLARQRWPQGRYGFLLIFCLINVCVAFYAVLKSGFHFTHYLQFLILPIGLLVGLFVQMSYDQDVKPFSLSKKMALIWLSICFAPHLLYRAASFLGYTTRFPITIHMEDLAKPLIISPVSKIVAAYSREGDDITVWGWQPAYHLETGLAQGTADVMVYRILTPALKQADFLKKYVSDLRRSMPVAFIDQISDHSNWFRGPGIFNHEHVPEVRDFVQKRYGHVATIDGERIYIRKDRLKAY